MVQLAVMAQSVPPDWFMDDALLLTVLDVMREQQKAAEKARQRRKR
jgi:hypothetical protein